MKRRLALPVILAVTAAIAVTVALLLPSSAPPSETEFTLLDGRKLTLQSLRGRPVLVSFWATTCSPCVAELPDLIRLYQEWQRLGFELIAVAMPYDPPTRVLEFVQRHGVPYPVALDIDGKITSAFGGVPYIPAAFLIAPNGSIELSYTGRLDIVKARRIISKYLPGTPSAS
ncbi:MAG: TlpA disulfide reductase family protein [Sulfuricaulis sp.]|nr:TlpA disulfide reductase family protein [Sulfuricaulis sp.]